MITPETVSVVKQATNDHIEQDVVHFESKEHKVELLLDLLARDEVEKVVVFGETKYGVQRLSDAITKNVCARIPKLLAERMEEIGSLLDLNKREMITLALNDFLAKAVATIEEFDAWPKDEEAK